MQKRNISSLLVIGLLMYSNTKAVNIRDAIKQKLVDVKIKWHGMENSESVSSRHGYNLRMVLQNLTNSDLKIEVPCGSMFTPKDTSRQNMIITEDIMVDLGPKKQKTEYANGYCCEAHDGAPMIDQVYIIRKPAKESLIKLARFIRDHKIQGYGVQRAIWSVSDKYDIDDINTGDTSSVALIRYVGDLRGIAKADIEKAILRSLKNNGKVYEQQIAIEIPIEKESLVWIMIQDVNNHTVKVVAAKQLAVKGILKRDVGVSSIDLGAGDFFVRVYSKDGFIGEKKFRLDS